MILLLRIAIVGKKEGDRFFTFWCLSEPESDKEKLQDIFPSNRRAGKAFIKGKFWKATPKSVDFKSIT